MADPGGGMTHPNKSSELFLVAMAQLHISMATQILANEEAAYRLHRDYLGQVMMAEHVVSESEVDVNRNKKRSARG